MRVMAHRGYSSQAPENTLAAFQRAIAFGCQWIELDVQLTADHIPVVIHDQTLERCTDGVGKIGELTFSELTQYSAGHWFDQAFSDETVPSLEATLQLAKQHQINLNIELKLYPGDDETLLCQRVAAVIDAVGIAQTQLLFSSFSTTALAVMQRVMPATRRGVLWETIPNHAFDILEALDAFSVHCDYRHLNEQQATAIKQHGYALYCYTPNHPLDVTKHWQWGVDMMITDKPHCYSQPLTGD
ncbi:glycerophosphoryl diester phosphodiesterase [Vibrio gazogenes]|uniref:Glycerophosphoryl diester phosphodiesterase n=1 Tax=Vibrio gazogenes DSM 21264 = NBRC 103151 TaxID=1123492 RepID=A0A1M4V5U2_VIBGA|nr:glycerophosphoryl diester phosphodiesterase [Vibrio gazogenes]USP15611.1 glycerophosphoryl diester phosphodiesterase [Vibrio gazogenes]SHE64356.1 glycerophosphoryl diester phosphodiesterase [Vibrio gazogenes DSM 21264] [Vibrio gazogenes DSM 21264 = NBRC 103151]SJN54625.1 Glycerophosphoryl diester phosphodiesterase [Vibrio gazogenes]